MPSNEDETALSCKSCLVVDLELQIYLNFRKTHLPVAETILPRESFFLGRISVWIPLLIILLKLEFICWFIQILLVEATFKRDPQFLRCFNIKITTNWDIHLPSTFRAIDRAWRNIVLQGSCVQITFSHYKVFKLRPWTQSRIAILMEESLIRWKFEHINCSSHIWTELRPRLRPRLGNRSNATNLRTLQLIWFNHSIIFGCEPSSVFLDQLNDQSLQDSYRFEWAALPTYSHSHSHSNSHSQLQWQPAHCPFERTIRTLSWEWNDIDLMSICFMFVRASRQVKKGVFVHLFACLFVCSKHSILPRIHSSEVSYRLYRLFCILSM
jgi:hypothetical protein